MKYVWVVLLHVEYEGYDLMGIYSTEKKAKEYVAEYEADEDFQPEVEYFTIEKMEIE